ncbi:NAD(P)H-quinone oxidoreductase [Chitinimonas viridis]|uniref:NAD(P)H-quinone oxidoreductase n=1 Tax=Chitinimonas viridis TaxID=664880 RepID=A0ABT8B9R3_9NEIS|nr:NAD(P)H-quinone oxidoreductase [Chitinimonas viridis]MDN3578993.1 NAD(P)H-quinone oxidoreductase [Chitinimonas viridis]
MSTPPPATMRALLQTAPGGADTLYMGTTATPIPAAGQLLVRVQAAGVNRADIVQREGRYPAPPGASPILGLEVAGEVAALGEGVTGFALGDAVFGLVAGGGYAQYAVLDADCAVLRPSWLSIEAAASLPEAWMTAWLNLVVLGGLQAGETALVHAGASGVGAAAIQLARLLGASAIATVGSEAKAAYCSSLGARLAINYRTADFAAEVKAAGGVELILDCIGGAYLEGNLASLKPDGRLVVIGLMGGAGAQLDIGRLLVKRLSVRGSTLRPQPRAVKACLTAALRDTVLPALAAGEVKLTLDQTFAWADAAQAHRYLEDNRNCGKVVLCVD